ncbi:PREDICTED: transmembrane protein 170A [Dufourea novaeangliae]|uniref:transmembrane protein 170A n=1 Tax=Dufourea novaeangliae TaxID=178035 RepID=UPI0007670339|nr:PREDICTED: transmembrane protein 170A [Dufourea novaeangliae]
MEAQTDVPVLRPPNLRNTGNVFYTPLTSFAEMWYQIFLWALFSSIFVHTIAGAICFATLRQHKYGKFFPLLIIIMGVLLPLTSGVLSSAAVAFVYRASRYPLPPLYALLWGIGQTVVAGCVGFTRILATL